MVERLDRKIRKRKQMSQIRNNYRIFIQDFSRVSKPLYELLQKKQGLTKMRIPARACERSGAVAHGQSKHSANVPLTLTGKPNPAQITL